MPPQSNDVLISELYKDEGGIMMLPKHQNYNPTLTPLESSHYDSINNISELKYNLAGNYKQLSTSPIILKIKNLNVNTEDGRKVLINKLNLEVYDGMRLLVTGPSGCGKSTLLRLIALLCYKEIHCSDKHQQQQQQQQSIMLLPLTTPSLRNIDNISELEVCSQLPFCFKVH